MGKTKNRNFRSEDREYMDGFKVDTRKSVDKKKEKRFERALRVKNVDELVEEESLDYDDYEAIHHEWKE